MNRFDRWFARAARSWRARTSRRHFLARLGARAGRRRGAAAAADGARGLRAGASPRPASPTRPRPRAIPTSCGYWRHCAIDGFLASCCGGTHTTCPPGTQMSPITWLGTCRNPADGREYVISYNDCCGKGFCGRCFCKRNEGDRPRLLRVEEQRHRLVHGHGGRRLQLDGGDRGRRRDRAASLERAASAALALALGLARRARGIRPRRPSSTTCSTARAATSRTAAARPARCRRSAGVGRFLRTSRGREYLIRVPGSAQSPLSDAALAALLDWIVVRFDPETAAAAASAASTRPRSRAGAARRSSEVDALRAALLRELSATEYVAARARRQQHEARGTAGRRARLRHHAEAVGARLPGRAAVVRRVSDTPSTTRMLSLRGDARLDQPDRPVLAEPERRAEGGGTPGRRAVELPVRGLQVGERLEAEASPSCEVVVSP